MILALLLAPGSGQSGGAQPAATAVVSVSAPTPSAAAIEPCAQVLSELPVDLDGNQPRQVHPYPDEGAPAVAWGNPPIVLQCGVARPKELVASSGDEAFLINAVAWLPVADSKQTVWTAVDRAVYIRVSVPKSYPQPPLATISDAIAKALPPLCHLPDPNSTATTSSAVGPLCTRRP